MTLIEHGTKVMQVKHGITHPSYGDISGLEFQGGIVMGEAIGMLLVNLPGLGQIARPVILKAEDIETVQY